MKNLIYSVVLLLLLSGCAAYSKFETPKPELPSSFRFDDANSNDTTYNVVKWKSFFSDTCLQKLIEEGLSNNTDLHVALLKVEESKAMLSKAKLAYLPEVGIVVDGSIGRYDGHASPSSYNAGLSASWELDVFGKLTASKRETAAAFESSAAYSQAVKTQLIATIAESYYMLSMLDTQIEINRATRINWEGTIRVMEALKKAGKSNDAAILQSRANLQNLLNEEASLMEAIALTENALCAVLAKPSETVKRNNLADFAFCDSLTQNIPVVVLANRPDVHQAEMELARMFYATNVARASFYPSLTLSGTFGFTNHGIGSITNPGAWLMNAVGQLTQPLFNRGALTANLKVAKAQYEEAKLRFCQSLVDAGKEVNDALALSQSANVRIAGCETQIDLLTEAVRKTELLMRYSDITYLEVLTAQQSLLDARLNLAEAQYDKITATIKLYHAIGGGGGTE